MPSCPATTRILVVLLASMSLACDDPLRPSDVAATYVLRSVRGQLLPAVFWQSDRAQMRVFADTLQLNADGTGKEVWHVEVIDQFGTTGSRFERPLRFDVRNAQLEGTYLCQPGVGCLTVIEPLRGEFTRPGLRIDIGKFSAGPLLFERADR